MRETNRAFAETHQAFKKACDRAKTPATKRQASKFRNERGIAYKNK